MSKRLRVGVIGAGGIAQMMHLPHLRELHEQFEVVGLADMNERTLEAVGAYYGITRLFTDYRELLKEDLNTVMILTNGNHAQMCLDAANAGKNIFCEKPLCYTIADADAIQEAVNRNGVTLMVGYMKRYDPAYRYGARAMKELTDRRYIRITVLHPASELYYQQHVFHPPAPAGPVPTREMAARIVASFAAGPEAALLEAVLGKDAPPIQRAALALMLGSLCHDVNAMRGLFGEPEAVVSTELWHDGLCMNSVLRYPNDVRASLTWTYLSDLRDYNEEIACFADAGRVKIIFPSPFLRNYPTEVRIQGAEMLPDRPESASWEKRVTVSYAEAFKEELLAFYDYVTNGKQPLTDVADSRADLTLIHAMAKAWKR